MALTYSNAETHVMMYDVVRRADKWFQDRKIPVPQKRPEWFVTHIIPTSRILEISSTDMKGDYAQVDPIDFELVKRGAQ